MTQKAQCPVCDGAITIADGTEESEIISCTECSNRVVVSSTKDGKTTREESTRN